MTRKRFCIVFVLALATVGAAAPALQTQTLRSTFGGDGCQAAVPPKAECVTYKCIPRDNSYEEVPLPPGRTCRTGGHCDGRGNCSIPTIGSLFTKYIIASVFYMPPGPSSYVDYGTGSVIGSSMSTTNSWKNSQKIEAKVGLGGAMTSLTATFGSDWSRSTKTQVDLKETVTQDMKASADPDDQINHDYDEILLLLSPRVDVVAFPSENSIQWTPDVSNAIPLIVLVGWLRGTLPMTAGARNVLAALARSGITESDYPEILKSNPFAADPGGTGRPDPARFLFKTRFPYVPVRTSYGYTVDNNYSSATTITSDFSYTVGFLSEAGTPSGQNGPISASLKFSDSFTWTSSSSQTNSSSSSNTSKLGLSMPSANYSGVTDLCVYVDTIYKTFFFSFIGPTGHSCSQP